MNLKSLFCAIISLTSCFAINLKAKETVENIQFFLINVDVVRHFSFGNWNSRQHVVIRMQTQNHEGWGECVGATNNPDFDIEKFSEKYRPLLGKTPDEIHTYLQNSKMKWKECEIAEMALWDIKGKIANKPSIELLNLNGTAPVNGIYCILENDPSKLAIAAQNAKKANLKNYIKMKAFGDIELDSTLVKTLRKEMGDKCYIVADANYGYKKFDDLNGLDKILKRLSDASLNALEDPADIHTNQAWIDLQKLTNKHNLTIIPDVPLRPAKKAFETTPKGMGNIYNLHPGCMGDFEYLSKLANKLIEWNIGIMIGDDSLVAAACTIYQQIAIGCGAKWVEALEKPQESTVFTDCIIEQSTYQQPDGLYAMHKKAGWGLKVDVEKLKNSKKVKFSEIK